MKSVRYQSPLVHDVWRVCVCVCVCVCVRHQIHVKEEPTEMEEDCRPVSLMASVSHNLSMAADMERDMEEELPTEELE